MQVASAERYQGCLLGLACGDALGAPVEFCQRGRFSPVTGMQGGGKFAMQPGEWTDDTAMALCLADSLLACQGFDARDQMQRYCRWVDEGYNSTRAHAFGVGKTVLRALCDFQQRGDPWAGSDDPLSSGNGSLMRLAPVVLFHAGNPEAALHFAEQSSRTTHASEECLNACRYFAAVLLRALAGERDKARLLTADPDYAWGWEITPVLQGSYRDKSIAEITGSGYVIESLEAALWCFWHSDSFADAVLQAVNLGDDADTTAAICGQLAGAFYGVKAIPEPWLHSLHARARIAGLADQLLLASGVIG